MSSGNNTDGGNNSNGANKVDWQHVASPNLIEQVENSLEVQIAKFDEQLCRQCDKLMKQAAEQEAQRKAEEEEARRKAEEDAQKRAKFQAQWQADMERKAREKAEAKAAAEAMRAHIVQKVVQGKKPKPKVHGMELFSSFLLLTYSFDSSNVRQPANMPPTRRSRGGTPRVTDARRAYRKVVVCTGSSL